MESNQGYKNEIRMSKLLPRFLRDFPVLKINQFRAAILNRPCFEALQAQTVFLALSLRVYCFCEKSSSKMWDKVYS